MLDDLQYYYFQHKENFSSFLDVALFTVTLEFLRFVKGKISISGVLHFWIEKVVLYKKIRQSTDGLCLRKNHDFY